MPMQVLCNQPVEGVTFGCVVRSESLEYKHVIAAPHDGVLRTKRCCFADCLVTVENSPDQVMTLPYFSTGLAPLHLLCNMCIAE